MGRRSVVALFAWMLVIGQGGLVALGGDVEQAASDASVVEQVQQLLQNDQYDEGVSLLQQHQGPGSATSIDMMLGNVYLIQGQAITGKTGEETERLKEAAFENALGAFNAAVAKDPDLLQAWRSMILIHYERGHNEKAIDALSEVVRLAPKDDLALLQLAMLHQGRFRKAKDEAEEAKAAGRVAEEAAARETASGEFGMAMMYFQRAETHESAACREQAFLGQGALFAATDQYDLALEKLRQAMAIQPREAVAERIKAIEKMQAGK